MSDIPLEGCGNNQYCAFTVPYMTVVTTNTTNATSNVGYNLTCEVQCVPYDLKLNESAYPFPWM